MPQGNWFPQNPENISTGWTPYHYTAPDIGGLVGDILKNRLAQQINTQNQFSDLAKTIQAQRQNEAFGEQASNAGLLPGVDTSGMSADQIKNLATLVQQQGTEAALNAQRQATADWISQNKPLAGGRGGGGRSGGNTVDIYDDQGNYVTSAPAGSALARQYLMKMNPSLSPGLTSSQAVGQAKALGIPEADFFDSSRHFGYQTVPGGVDQQGNSVPLPLSPDQDPSEATHVGIKPSTATNQNAPPVIIPRSVFSRIRQGLGAQDSAASPAQPPPQTGGGTARVPPNASAGAPINMPKKGDVVNGYAFIGEEGDDPKDPKNWTPAGQP